MPLAQRALGKGHRLTLKTRWNYAQALCKDDGATLNDLHEAVTTLQDADRIARRVLGSAHPLTVGIEGALRKARPALRAREEARTRGAASAGDRPERAASDARRAQTDARSYLPYAAAALAVAAVLVLP